MSIVHPSFIVPFDLLFFYNYCPQQLWDRLLKVGDGIVSCSKWTCNLDLCSFFKYILGSPFSGLDHRFLGAHRLWGISYNMFFNILTWLNIFSPSHFWDNQKHFPTAHAPPLQNQKENICTKSKEHIFSQEMATGTVCFYAQMEAFPWTSAVFLWWSTRLAEDLHLCVSTL